VRVSQMCLLQSSASPAGKPDISESLWQMLQSSSYTRSRYSTSALIFYFCFPGCQSKWKPMRNSQVFNGRPLMAETLVLCQDACIGYSGCDGIDWNPDEAAGSRCWLSGAWITGWNNGSAPGVTHYVLSTNC
jgi:hypothetical protein